MLGRWWRGDGVQRPVVSADFDHALTREVLRTELVRIKSLIITTLVLLVVSWAIDLVAPEGLDHIWRGRFRPIYLNVILIPFILFELWIHANISRHLRLDRDLPVIRRYLGVLIETSLPTIALAVHIKNMGLVEALGFVMPFAYFIFIILSTLRLDFWLSTFTGFVAATELFCLAMFYHPDATSDPAPDIWYHAARSIIILVSGVLAGAVGVQLRRQFAASIAAATARDRVTSLFGQHVSPQVAERLLVEGARTDSDIRHVAVMFVDFRSFTAEARSRSPQQVVDRLDARSPCWWKFWTAMAAS
jgi:adenylate cyclase